MNLNTPLGQLNRVGKVVEKRLKYLGLETARDLLFYFPFRYEDYSQVKDIKDLKEGEIVTIKGRIELLVNKRSHRQRKIITEAVVADDTDRVKIIWFGQPFITKTLKVGDLVYLSGKVTSDFFGVQMVGPTYEKFQNNQTTHTARIVPMYPLTAGVTNKQLRFLMSQIIGLAKDIPEWLPEAIQEKADLMPLAEAIKAIHFPESNKELEHATRRLKFDELFIMQLRAEMARQLVKSATAPKIIFKETEIKKFVQSLPFVLTKAQKVSAWEILQDMNKDRPMNRLLEGDVGSGKTVVAAMAMYNAVLNGYQAVLMAPTEILARQHFESLSKLLGDKVSIALLTHSQFLIYNFKFLNNFKLNNDKIFKKQIIELIKDGKVDIIVGTHALLSENVEFNKLGLVIVDEQHRFGVEQRKILKKKVAEPVLTLNPLSAEREGIEPHFLSMTATPIPRSFALALYGDLDLSIINEMPKDRKIIKTRLVEPHNRQKAYEFIRAQVKQGRQVFVICPLISRKEKGESRKSEDEIEIINYPQNSFSFSDEKKSVESEYEKLSKKIFPDLKIGYLHGKLKSKEKEETMKKFSEGKIDILVSTSVVEVGVDIPNASVMMIEGAEKFGLAQLHQFRGRVGRSSYQSYCFLFTDSDAQKAIERLKYFETTNDGFKVAEYDLKVRGPGEVYGTTQSGLMNLRLATLQDGEIIKLAREVARGVDFKQYPVLWEKVKEWENSVHLE